MKCRACNYEEDGSNRDFIQIESRTKFEIENTEEPTPGDYDYERKIGVRLCACPECFTVVMAQE